MTTTCVVQARTGSTRLPDKVLAEIGGTSVLAFLLRRLAGLRDGTVDDIVVATSTASRDDRVASIATTEGFAVVRGSEDDVLGRYGVALDAHPADLVVRITADCPLSDPAIIREMIERAVTAGADYTSNTLIRTYPDGLDVEVVAATALRSAVEEAVDADEREHVTPFVYRRPRRFRLGQVTSGELLGEERWTLDTADDLARIRSIVSALSDPVGAGWRDMLEVAPPRSRAADASYLVPDIDFPLTTGRAWTVAGSDEPRGRVVVEVVEPGKGIVTTDGLTGARRAAAIDLARAALTGDKQVTVLVEG